MFGPFDRFSPLRGKQGSPEMWYSHLACLMWMYILVPSCVEQFDCDDLDRPVLGVEGYFFVA